MMLSLHRHLCLEASFVFFLVFATNLSVVSAVNLRRKRSFLTIVDHEDPPVTSSAISKSTTNTNYVASLKDSTDSWGRTISTPIQTTTAAAAAEPRHYTKQHKQPKQMKTRFFEPMPELLLDLDEEDMTSILWRDLMMEEGGSMPTKVMSYGHGGGGMPMSMSMYYSPSGSKGMMSSKSKKKSSNFYEDDSIYNDWEAMSLSMSYPSGPTPDATPSVNMPSTPTVPLTPTVPTAETVPPSMGNNTKTPTSGNDDFQPTVVPVEAPSVPTMGSGDGNQPSTAPVVVPSSPTMSNGGDTNQPSMTPVITPSSPTMGETGDTNQPSSAPVAPPSRPTIGENNETNQPSTTPEAVTLNPTMADGDNNMPSNGSDETLSPTSNPTVVMTNMPEEITDAPTSTDSAVPETLSPTTVDTGTGEPVNVPTVGIDDGDVATTSSPTVPNTVPEIVMPTATPVSSTSAPTTDGGDSVPTTSLPGCEALDRTDAIFFVLFDLTDPNELDNPTIPPGQAFRWIWLSDPLQLNPCETSKFLQRFSLSVLFYATDGPNWLDNSGWISGDDECTWFGIQCDDTNTVSSVILENNNLVGALPKEIKALTGLEVLNFSDNSLEEVVPPIFEALVNLKEFDIERNLLQGQVFNDIVNGALSLESFKISSNFFSGTIPEEIGLLSNLVNLWMAENRFAGELPATIGTLTKLETFYAYANALAGVLPSEMGAMSLKELQLFRNNFAGSIPPELLENTDLTLLRLDFNRLTGTIPSNIGNVVQLKQLWLLNNTISGPLPPTILRLSNLEALLLNNNELTGTLRDGFETFTRLNFTDLSNNQLSGTIPGSFFEIPTLTNLYLNNNSFTGEIPSNYGNASSLRDLFLSSNSLTGTIPDINPGQLGELNEFLLDNTRLEGNMPKSICNLRTSGRLEDLWVDCLGSSPEVACNVPECCTACF